MARRTKIDGPTAHHGPAIGQPDQIRTRHHAQGQGPDAADLDRLPLLTWIMFLKFLDDREQVEEAKAEMGGKKYSSAIEPPYRWRDWAANAAGITGGADRLRQSGRSDAPRWQARGRPARLPAQPAIGMAPPAAGT